MTKSKRRRTAVNLDGPGKIVTGLRTLKDLAVAVHVLDVWSMQARLRKLLDDLAEAFWLVPALMVLVAIAGALGCVWLDRSQLLPAWLLKDWLYDGGATGARTLLGAVASSTIGVAGTIFSITIAALSLAAGQMGPRLLRNFTRDRGNQITLGIFLATFSYALVVLRSVRTPEEGDFIPHLSLTLAILFAFFSVATLVYFVGHLAGRINVDNVVELVSGDVHSAVRRLTFDCPQPPPPPDSFWRGATAVKDSRKGYLQQLDDQGLATWASNHRATVRLLVRPGDFVFPGAPIALTVPAVDGAEEAVRNATALGSQRVSSADLEFAIRQLVEVAIRALSPGINDPYTAISVLDRLGAMLCEIAERHLPSGVFHHDNRVALVVPPFTYDGLVDAMFHMVRQNSSGKPALLIRILDVLTAVTCCEEALDRRQTLKRHADLIVSDAERTVETSGDLEDVKARYQAFIKASEIARRPTGHLVA